MTKPKGKILTLDGSCGIFCCWSALINLFASKNSRLNFPRLEAASWCNPIVIPWGKKAISYKSPDVTQIQTTSGKPAYIYIYIYIYLHYILYLFYTKKSHYEIPNVMPKIPRKTHRFGLPKWEPGLVAAKEYTYVPCKTETDWSLYAKKI